MPHLDAERFGAFLSKADDRTKTQAEALHYSDALIAELKAADFLTIGAPLYNFSIASTLKAYIDHIARAGVTFRYTDKGPIGLLTGKKAYVFSTRGGVYSGTPLDLQTPYLRTVLGLPGHRRRRVRVRRGACTGIRQEGTGTGEGRRPDRRARHARSCRNRLTREMLQVRGSS